MIFFSCRFAMLFNNLVSSLLPIFFFFLSLFFLFVLVSFSNLYYPVDTCVVCTHVYVFIFYFIWRFFFLLSFSSVDTCSLRLEIYLISFMYVVFKINRICLCCSTKNDTILILEPDQKIRYYEIRSNHRNTWGYQIQINWMKDMRKKSRYGKKIYTQDDMKCRCAPQCKFVRNIFCKNKIILKKRERVSKA